MTNPTRLDQSFSTADPATAARGGDPVAPDTPNHD
jgi:hypothetical protein